MENFNFFIQILGLFIWTWERAFFAQPPRPKKCLNTFLPAAAAVPIQAAGLELDLRLEEEDVPTTDGQYFVIFIMAWMAGYSVWLDPNIWLAG